MPDTAERRHRVHHRLNYRSDTTNLTNFYWLKPLPYATLCRHEEPPVARCCLDTNILSRTRGFFNSLVPYVIPPVVAVENFARCQRKSTSDQYKIQSAKTPTKFRARSEKI
jgi:hypothetical protein